MVARPIWKGQIRLSLVSIPVEMYSATKAGSSISFRQIHRESGKRIQYEKVAPGIGAVERDEIVKGYEIGKDQYVLLTDEEIEDVKLETKKTLELVQFVETSEIPPLYFDKPYYVVPQDELAEDAFRVVRDALRQSKKTGLGQLAMRGREYLVALRPCGRGLLMETLHYEDEIRKSDPIFAEISNDPADEDLLAVATQLIEKKTSKFNAKNYKDHYTDALKELIALKRSKGSKAKLTVEEEEPRRPQGSNVVDLMATLKKSLEQNPKDESSGSSKTTRTKAASSKTGSSKTAAKAKAPAKAAPAKSKSTASRTKAAPARARKSA